MKNIQVKANLEKLFKVNFEAVNSLSIETFFDQLVAQPVMAYDPSTDEFNGVFDEEEIEALKEARQDSELLNAFKKVAELNFDDNQIIEGFKKDIVASLAEIRKNLKNDSFSNQIIFLENDFEPYAYFCGFGTGNYPILSEPDYFDYNFKEEIYNGVGKIDYSVIWNDLLHLNDLLVELEIEDIINETEYFQNLLNALKFKTYLFLHDTFDQLGIEIFRDFKIEKPLYIYANEHDCPAMNVYIFE